MLSLLRSVYQCVLHLDGESGQILRMLGMAGNASGLRVLDVGCGYGRMLRLMSEAGFDAAGVEINPDIVEENRKAGLRCWTPEDLEQSMEQFDAILMAHVIEHFSPAELLKFMDTRHWHDLAFHSHLHQLIQLLLRADRGSQYFETPHNHHEGADR